MICIYFLCDVIGIITKTDITRAFAEEVPSSTIAEAFMSSKDLICVRTDTQTDDIADLIQKKFVHHLVVVDDKGVFAGVASSWDVAREVSLDAKAFPYNRELWTKPKKVIARSTDKAPVMQWRKLDEEWEKRRRRKDRYC